MKIDLMEQIATAIELNCAGECNHDDEPLVPDIQIVTRVRDSVTNQLYLRLTLTDGDTALLTLKIY